MSISSRFSLAANRVGTTDVVKWRLDSRVVDYARDRRFERAMGAGEVRTTGMSADAVAIVVLIAALEALGYDPREADAPM